MKRQTNNRNRMKSVCTVCCVCMRNAILVGLGLIARDEKKQQTIDLSASRDGALNAVAFLFLFNLILLFRSFRSLFFGRFVRDAMCV